VRRILRFDCFHVDQKAHQLFKHDARIRLRDQAFRVLSLLMNHAGDVVTREDLRRHLWADDTFVDFQNGLNTTIGRLREALGDSADRPRYIETLPRVGYRFIARVTEEPGPVAGAAPRSTTRLLVLPLVNANGDPSLDYFSNAVTDEIIAELAALAPSTLGVIARTTAMHYKGTAKPIAEIARDLTLDWVLEGSVRRMDNRFILTTQLIRASDETHVLARRFEADFADIHTIERSVAEIVGDQLGLTTPSRVADAERPSETGHPRPTISDVVAYSCYIQGRHHFVWGESPQSWGKARGCLEAALARDPQFALAHVALADLWWHTGFFALMSPTDTLRIGMKHAERAVELDPGLAEAHAMLAQYRKQVAFDWDEVAREMALAIELNPASPDVRLKHAVTGLMPLGRLSDAIHDAEIALELDPLGLYSRAWLAVMHWLNRDDDRAIEQGRTLLDIEPTHFLAHYIVGMVTREARLFPEAVAAHRRAAELSADNPLMLGWLGLALAESGDAAGARAVLSQLAALPPHIYVPPTSLAWIHLGLGEIDEFFRWMTRAIDARDHMITPIRTYPFLDPVRGDPRYAELLERMHLG